MKIFKKFDSKYNYVILVALLIIAYFSYVLISYANKPKIFAYQVQEGSLAENNIYTGIIIRDEKVFNSEGVGYVGYFAREGEHVGVGDLIYTIDESGAMENLIEDNLGENKLSNKELKDLRVEASNFSTSFDKRNFSKTYDFEYSMNGLVLKLANMNILDKLSAANSKALSDIVILSKATEPGYVVYNTDGYESVSENGINSELFDKQNYDKNQMVNNTLVNKSDSVYKMIQSEEWNIAIELSKEKAKSFEGIDYVKVKFLENQRVLNASIKVIQNGDEYFAILGMNTDVLNYCTERFVDIEIQGETNKGLKIPVSSIVHKEFFLIPKEYAIEEGEENTFSVLRKTFKEDGTIDASLYTVEVYAENQDYYYVDDSSLRIGEYLLLPDSSNEFPVSTKGELVGVYNINKGYADFRQINILYQNDEYAIVKSNTDYGLNVYDFIVLDSTSVNDEQLIY